MTLRLDDTVNFSAVRAPTVEFRAVPKLPRIPRTLGRYHTQARHLAQPDRLTGDLAGNLILLFGWATAIVTAALGLYYHGTVMLG